MDIEFWGRSSHHIKSLSERIAVVKQSTVTETTQLSWSNDLCSELRNERFDETGILAGASLRDA